MGPKDKLGMTEKSKIEFIFSRSLLKSKKARKSILKQLILVRKEIDLIF